MATYYIDPEAASTGNGTLSSPFSSWSWVTWSAGNTYLQKQGTTFSSTVTVAQSGSAGNPIVLGTYGENGSQVENAVNKAKIQTSSGSAVVALAKSYINIVGLQLVPNGSGFALTGSSNINISYCSSTGGSNGVYGERANTVTVSDCTFRNGSGIGVAIYANATTDAHTWTIQRTTIYGYTNQGIHLFPRSNGSTAGNVYSVTIDNCTVNNCGSYGIETQGAVFTTAGSQCWGIVVKNSRIHSNGKAGIRFLDHKNTIQNVIQRNEVYNNCATASTEGGIWCGRVENLVVEYNVVYNNHSQNNVDGMGIMIDWDGASVGCTDVVVRGNEVYGHDDAQVDTVSGNSGIIVIYATNASVYGNISHNNWRGISCGHDTTTGPVAIFNNTCYNNSVCNFYLYDAITSATLTNNISLGGGYGIENDGTATVTANYNIVHGASTSNYRNQSAGANDKDVNPELDPRGRPKRQLAFNGGSNLGGTDLYGNTFPESPSFGAIQCVGVYPSGMLTDYESVGDKESFIRGRSRRR